MSQYLAFLKTYIRQIKDEFKNSDNKGKLKILGLIALAIFGVWFAMALILGIIITLVAPGSGMPMGRIFAAIVMIPLLAGIFKYGTTNDLRNETAEQDKAGVTRMEKGVQGTAYKMGEEETRKEFLVDRMGDSNNVILGSLDKEGTEIVRIPTSPYGDDLQNILFVGSSGSQKSRCFVENEVINSTKRGESAVFADPSLGLYTKYNLWCRNQGADVYCVNFKVLQHSDGWNCLQETIDDFTGRIDPSKLNTFVKVFVDNCNAGDKEDAFWYSQSTNYLKATIGYVAWRREDQIVKFLKRLYLHVAGTYEKKTLIASLFRDLVSINWCKAQIYAMGQQNGYDKQTLENAVKKIEAYADPFNLDEVVKCMKDFEIVESAYAIPKGEPGYIPINQVGKDAYRIVAQNKLSDNAKASGVVSALGKMTLFTDPVLTYNLSRDGINLKELNKKHTVCFVGMPDNKAELAPITSLFFTFLFQDSQDNWDMAAALSSDDKVKNPILDTNIVLDDFFSIGVIGGDPTLYTTWMANARKRHLHIYMIIQDIGQLKTRYGADNYNTILSNSNYQICFGAGEPNTMKYFSEMSGKATVMKVTERRTDGFIPTRDPELVVTTEERNVYNSDEVWAMDKSKCIVIKQNKRALELYKVSYENNPVVVNGETKETMSCFASIKSYYDKLVEEEASKSNRNATGLNDYIDSLKPSMYVDENGEIHPYICTDDAKGYSEAKGVSLTGHRPEKAAVKIKSESEHESPKSPAQPQILSKKPKQTVMNKSGRTAKSAFNS